jgi:putative transposase
MDGARWLGESVVVSDCYTRELLGWHLSGSAKATNAESAPEQALINRYGPKQEFITPHCPEQNGMMESVIRTIKEQYVHR